MKLIQLLIFQVAILYLAACASTPKIAGDSIIRGTPQLNTIDGMRLMGHSKYGCNNTLIKHAKLLCTKGDVKFNSEGNLSSGIVNEEWTADHCGTIITYSIRYRPSPNGGTRFRVEEKEIKTE